MAESSLTTVVVSNPAELHAAFGSIDPGGRIELMPGDYSWTRLSGRTFAEPVTITSHDPEDPAVFTSELILQGVSGLTVSGVDVIADDLAYSPYLYHMAVYNSSNVTLQDIEIRGHIPTEAEGVDPDAPDTWRFDPITGYGYARGLQLRNSHDIEVRDVTLSDLFQAVVLTDIRDVDILQTDIHSVREGINLYDAGRLTIADSGFHHFQSWRQGPGDHSDMIQYWVTRNDTFGVRDVEIRDNVFYQPDIMQSQSIFGSGAGATGSARVEDFDVSGNLIVNAHTNAIRLQDVDGVSVAGNVLLPGDPAAAFYEMPAIHLHGSVNGTVSGNLVPQRGVTSGPTALTSEEAAAANIDVSGNTMLSLDANAATYWKTVYDQVAVQLPPEPTSELTPGIDPNDVAVSSPAPAPRLEAGTVRVTQDDGDHWHSVTFEAAIPDARVVMGPVSGAGIDPAVARVRNVTDTGFEFQIDEWDYLDGWHTAESLSWIAGSAGTHTLGGHTVGFGRVTAADATPVTVSLSDFADTPAAFAQVTSANGAAAVTTRLSEVTATDFSVRLQQEEAAGAAHPEESLDWLAIDYGDGGAGHAGPVDHTGSEIALAGADELVFLAAMQTAAGPDTAALRLDARGPDGAVLRLEEEQSADWETTHVDEQTAYLALAPGTHDLAA